MGTSFFRQWQESQMEKASTAEGRYALAIEMTDDGISFSDIVAHLVEASDIEKFEAQALVEMAQEEAENKLRASAFDMLMAI